MSGIESVTGWVDDADLGFTLVHEHVAGSSPGILRSWAGLSGGREHLVTTAVTALADARSCGVRTIVDCTTFDLGRDAELLAEVARASGVTVIACSGMWLDPSVTVRARTVAQLADWFIHDLTEGMDGTTVRAAVIKVATEEAIGTDDAKILEAAGCTVTTAPAEATIRVAAQGISAAELNRLAASNGITLRRLAEQTRSLERAFFALTGTDDAGLRPGQEMGAIK